MNARDQVTIHSIAQLAASSCTHTPPSFPLHSVPTSTSPSQAPLPTPAPAARPPVPPLPHPPPPTPLAYLHIPLPGCLRGVAQGIGEGVHQGQQEEHVELELRRLQQVVADAVKHLQPRGGGRRYKGGAGRGGGGGVQGCRGATCMACCGGRGTRPAHGLPTTGPYLPISHSYHLFPVPFSYAYLFLFAPASRLVLLSPLLQCHRALRPDLQPPQTPFPWVDPLGALDAYQVSAIT